MFLSVYAHYQLGAVTVRNRMQCLRILKNSTIQAHGFRVEKDPLVCNRY